jgi:hypothetical protein
MKCTTRLLAHACTVVALTAVAVPAVAEDVTFAYKFEPGSTERHRAKLNQEVTMGPMAVSNIADMEVTVKCVSGKDGKYAMEMTFDKVDVSMTMGSTTTANPMGAQLTGQTIAFTTDANGEVSDIKPAGSFAAWGSARQLVEPIIESWYPHLPNKAVPLGGEWKKEGDKKGSDSGMETDIDAAFKFKELKKEKGRDIAVVEQTMTAKVSGKTETPMGNYNVAGGGKGKGDFHFDPSKSRVVRLKGQIDLNMDMTPEAGGDPVQTVITNHVERQLLE